MNNFYGFSEEAYESFLEGMAERYDFGTRCRRPDGSFYGTDGQCRAGTIASPATKKKSATKKKPPEKWCNQYRPWMPVGQQVAIVPCRELGIK